MPGEEVLYLPLTELGGRLREGSLSAVELTETYLDRISRRIADAKKEGAKS